MRVILAPKFTTLANDDRGSSNAEQELSYFAEAVIHHGVQKTIVERVVSPCGPFPYRFIPLENEALREHLLAKHQRLDTASTGLRTHPSTDLAQALLSP